MNSNLRYIFIMLLNILHLLCFHALYHNLNLVTYEILSCLEHITLKTWNNATNEGYNTNEIQIHPFKFCSNFSSCKLTPSKQTAIVEWSNIPRRISFLNMFCHFHCLLQLWTISCTFHDRNCILHCRRYSMLHDMWYISI